MFVIRFLKHQQSHSLCFFKHFVTISFIVRGFLYFCPSIGGLVFLLFWAMIDLISPSPSQSSIDISLGFSSIDDSQSCFFIIFFRLIWLSFLFKLFKSFREHFLMPMPNFHAHVWAVCESFIWICLIWIPSCNFQFSI